MARSSGHNFYFYFLRLDKLHDSWEVRKAAGHDGLARGPVEKRDRRQSLLVAVVVFAVEVRVDEVNFDVVVFVGIEVVEKLWIEI